MASSPDWSELPTSTPPPGETPPDDSLPFYRHPYRLAGAMLLANAPLVALESVVVPGGTGTPPMLPLLLDLVIGGSLVQGGLRFRTWAMLRAVLGLVLNIGMSAVRADFCSPIVAALYVVALLNLLIGTGASRAGLPRILASVGSFGLYLLMEVLGLLALALGLA